MDDLTISVLRPDGRKATIPASSLAMARQKGYTVIGRAPVAPKVDMKQPLESRLGDLIKNNADLLGGTLGGVLGAAGGPAGAVGGAALGGGAGRALTQLLDFAGGKGKKTSAEAATDIGIGGAEQGAYEVGGQAVSKLGQVIKPIARAAKLAYGSRSGALYPAIEKLLPDLDKTVERLGGQAPRTIGDFDQVVHATERGMQNEFGLAIFPIKDQPIASNTVRKAVLDQITPNMQKTASGRMAAKYLQKRADEFAQSWTVGEMNAERELVTKRLRAWHAAAASGQAAQARVQEHIAADTAIEKALKDLLYDAADKSGVKPPGYFQALKKKQSELIDLADSVRKAKEGLMKASSERSGAPWSEKIHLRGYLHPSTGLPSGVAGVSPSLLSDPLTQANKAIARGFPTGARAAVNAARTGAAKAMSQRDLNALPLRLLFGNYEDQGGDQP